MRFMGRTVTDASSSTHAGELLRYWRQRRRMSQLELSLEADISARHLSYMETGRAQPGREVLRRLADVLALPLRERNALLVAAGYAPLYRETTLGDRELEQVNRAVEFVLRQQEPYPAIILDRYWDIVRANDSAVALVRFIRGESPHETNLLRSIFSPQAARPFIANWDEVAADLLHRLANEASWHIHDDTMNALMEEIMAMPGVADISSDAPAPATSPLLATVFRKDGVELSLFSTFTAFGTPWNVTLDELRIECSYPADENTEQAFRHFAREGTWHPAGDSAKRQ